MSLTVVPDVTPIITPQLLATIDPHDPAILRDGTEQITLDVGLGIEVTVHAVDLVAVCDAARRALDRIEEAVLDCRDEHRDARRLTCPSCGFRYDHDEPGCPDPRCAG